MAVVQYTAIVNQLRGKLNGSQFNKSRTTQTLGSKSTPVRGAKGLQSPARSVFATIQRAWSAYTPTEKSNWQELANNNPDTDRFGNQVVLSGYNKYIQLATYAQHAGLFFPSSPPVATAPPIQINSVSGLGVSFSTLPSGLPAVAVSGSINVNAFGGSFYMIVYISYPFSPGVTSYHGSRIYQSRFFVSGSMGFSGNRNLSANYPVPVTGQQVKVWLEFHWFDNFVRVNRFSQVLII